MKLFDFFRKKKKEELQPVKMIVGLGNPGSKYENTRHNMGFAVIDELASRAGIEVNVNREKGLTGMGVLAGEKVLLVKPLTYMNLSGECAAPLAHYYRIAPEDILIVCDDINLSLGQLRIRLKGSAGGHNGLKNLIKMLGSDAFPRIRCGCGFKPEQMDLADFVLSHFTGEELKNVHEEWKLAADAAELFLREGGGAAMNRYNGKAEK